MVELEERDIIYRRLQEHLDQMPIGFPRAESGSDIKVLKFLFTPEEAKIATYLRFGCLVPMLTIIPLAACFIGNKVKDRSFTIRLLSSCCIC